MSRKFSQEEILKKKEMTKIKGINETNTRDSNAKSSHTYAKSTINDLKKVDLMTGNTTVDKEETVIKKNLHDVTKNYHSSIVRGLSKF